MASPVHNMMVKMARAGINWSPSKTKRANLDNQIDEKSFPIAGANPTGEKKKGLTYAPFRCVWMGLYPNETVKINST